MTTKAKLIILLRKWSVKDWRIFFRQEFEIFAAVSDMASTAIIVVDGTMKEFFTFDLVGKGRQNFIFSYFLGLIMTGHANRSWFAFEYEFN